MFNAYTTRYGPDSISINKTVHEHRAPTDESVRLLREMENKATEQIIQAVRIENTEFKGVLHTTREVLTGDVRFTIVFSLNGKKEFAEFRAKEWDTQDTVIQGIIRKVSETLARKMLVGIVKPEHLIGFKRQS